MLKQLWTGIIAIVVLAGCNDNANGYRCLLPTGTELKEGDKLTFICDYYTYDGKYQDTYPIGDITVSSNMQISNTDVGEGKVKLAYLFTDIYNQKYWTPTIDR